MKKSHPVKGGFFAMRYNTNLLDSAGRSQFGHEPTFTPADVARMQNMFAGGFVQGAASLLNGRFRSIQVARFNELVRLFDIGSR